METMKGRSSAVPAGRYLEDWYHKFTHWSTFKFVVTVSGIYFLGYLAWALLWVYLSVHYPEQTNMLHADFALKVLTFLVGLLISLTLKESLDRYRSCLGSLIDFRDEFRSFWYLMQMKLVDLPAAQLLTDMHMVCFVISLLRFLLRRGNLQVGRVVQMVQPEFRRCALFADDEVYKSLCSNPAYSELLLITWLRAMGIMDRDARHRFQLARTKLHNLLTAQRVRSPKTSVHLLRTVTNLFLLLMPVCSSSAFTKLSTPVISLVLFALLSLSEELEDPFGVDEHDLPWGIIVGTVSFINISPASEAVMEESIDFFNDGVRFGKWDGKEAKRLFGKFAITKDEDRKGVKNTYDTLKVDLSVYLTQRDLQDIDIVGTSWQGNPDVLCSVKFAQNGSVSDSEVSSDG